MAINNVVALPVEQHDAFTPLVPVDAPAPAKRVCSHLHVEYSVRERTLRCRDCDELVDAFDWLVGYAEREARRLAWDQERQERKRAAAQKHAARRRAKAAAAELAAGPILPRDEAKKRIDALRARLG